MREIKGPLDKESIQKLRAGEEVLFSGVFYTARDQAHKRLVELLGKKKEVPFKLKGEIIYYSGPSATPKGKVIGSCGPTTASRMDSFVDPLLREGLLGMVGKGSRSKRVKDLIRKHRAIYFLAPAGCGALLAESVIKKRKVCFADLGPEAVFELRVRDFPLIVGIDSRGDSIYQ